MSILFVTSPVIPPFVIADAHITERGNGSILLNPNAHSIRTAGLYLSNTRDNLQLWRLPAATVPPRATLEPADRQTGDYSHRFRIQINFDIRYGDELYLLDESERIMESFALRPGQEPRELP